MEDSGNVVNPSSGSINFQGYAPTIKVEEINQALEVSSSIPPDAKAAVRNFIQEKWSEIIECIGDLSKINIPPELIEHLDGILEVIKYILSSIT